MKALITGASSDLGIALAQALHHKGYELLLTARSKPPLPFPFHAADLTQDRSPIISWIQEECPSLIINNSPYARIEEEKRMLLIFSDLKNALSIYK